MASMPDRVYLEDAFCRRFDQELRQANLSLSGFHHVLDRMGAVGGDGSAPLTTVHRLAWLILEQASRDQDRVEIGCSFRRHPRWKFLLGVPLIYVPILVGILPMIVCAVLVRTHLTLVGGHRLKSYWRDFVPSWISHRYTRRTQIMPHRLFDQFGKFAFIARSRLFWIFNCKLYCPLSVALLAYVLYLVKIVEHWWCPFGRRVPKVAAPTRLRTGPGCEQPFAGTRGRGEKSSCDGSTV